MIPQRLHAVYIILEMEVLVDNEPELRPAGPY